MVCALACKIAALLAVAHIVSSLIENNTLHEVNNNLKEIETRRKGKGGKRSRSTSSSSGEVLKSSEVTDGSLDLSVSSSSSSSSASRAPRKYKPKSTEERKGWRKWHRKCPPCPEDMVKKWRDVTIKWICGGYQRARRSFKSECMMHYRNCQDGTMFVKIRDHRCDNDTGREMRRGEHFFYDYGEDSQRSGGTGASSSIHMSSEFYR